jgi:Protein of unknown function (DUF3307)
MYEQFLIHGWGDYILGQSDWMALNKSKRTIPCLVHVLLYTSFFLILTTSWKALLVIGLTHFIIDRFPIIVKRLIWIKNHMNPFCEYPPFTFCDTTGYYDDSPYNTTPIALDKEHDVLIKPYFWGPPRLFSVTIWLYIITDNLLHLTINYFALKYL